MARYPCRHPHLNFLCGAPGSAFPAREQRASRCIWPGRFPNNWLASMSTERFPLRLVCTDTSNDHSNYFSTSPRATAAERQWEI
jgi:hypothetical protein